MASLFFLAAFFNFLVYDVCAEPLLGATLCTRGPAYWCQDLATAEACQAEKYCHEKVWAKDNNNNNNNNNNSDENDVVKSVPMVPVMGRAMKVVPMASISGEAKLLAPEVGVPSFDICTYCEEVVNYSKILLGSPDAEAQIKALLMGMCRNLGALEDACESFVNKDLDEIIQTMKHLDTKQICVNFHLCSSSVAVSQQQNSFQRLPSLLCDKCKGLTLSLLDLLHGAKFLSNLSVSLCHLLGRDDLICHYEMGTFLSAVKVAGSNEYFCTPFCHESQALQCLQSTLTSSALPPTSAALPTTAAPPITTEPPTPATTTAPPPQPPACAKCVDALVHIKRDMKAKLSCLEDKLKKSCDVFPPLAEECKAAVEGFFKPLNDQINGLQPKALCVQIGVCNPSEEEPVPKFTQGADLCLYCEQTVNYAKVIIGNPDAEAEIESLLLNMCQNLGPLKGGCERYVEDNIQEIFKKLEHVDTKTICQDVGFCQKGQEIVKDKTSSFPEGPVDFVPVGILGGVNRPKITIHESEPQQQQQPEADAAVVHLLKVKAKQHSQISIHKKDDDSEVMRLVASSNHLELPQMSCFTCKFVMLEAKRELSEESTIEQLSRLAEKMCGKLAGDLKAQCDDFLSLFAEKYIKMAIDQLNGEKICELMGACEPKPDPSSPPHHHGNPLACFGCKHGLKELQDFWKNDKGLRNKVLNVMQSACLRLPDQKSIQSCVDEVDVMFPVFSELVENLDVVKICQNSGACAE